MQEQVKELEEQFKLHEIEKQRDIFYINHEIKERLGYMGKINKNSSILKRASEKGINLNEISNTMKNDADTPNAGTMFF